MSKAAVIAVSRVNSRDGHFRTRPRRCAMCGASCEGKTCPGACLARWNDLQQRLKVSVTKETGKASNGPNCGATGQIRGDL